LRCIKRLRALDAFLLSLALIYVTLVSVFAGFAPALRDNGGAI
jgi:hypothetical protein